jgi:type IV pilus assembly protein PilY1
MKYLKFFSFVLLLYLLLSLNAHADDTDLYVGNYSAIEPNILIIFDKSGSMNDTLTGVKTYCTYNPGFTYPQPPDIPSVSTTKVYRMRSGSWFPSGSPVVYKNSVGEVPCPEAQTTLTQWGKGVFSGRPDYSDCSSGNSRTIATGNWLRFNFATEENKETCKTKLEIAKEVICDFLDTVQGVRIGVMTFGPDPYEGGQLLKDVVSLESATRQELKDTINAISGGGYTPLAETLYEAATYFKGAPSYFRSGTTYTSPIQYYCQRNYVILMTDGISTRDRNGILDTIGDQNGDQKEPIGAPNDPDFDSDGSDFLDDVSKYYYDQDISALQNKQNITTYTIGFELDASDPAMAPLAKDLLQRAATYGHGKFYTTEGNAGLANAFSSVLDEVLAKTSSFVAPIVPVSRFERTTAGDKIYLAFFRPNAGKMWSGNIKKYGVAQSNNPSQGIVAGDILDSSGSKALDANGAFYPSTKSYWTTSSSDGGEVEVGGVGEILKARSTARNIYTLLPGDPQDEDDGPDLNTSFELTNSWNAFAKTNSRLTASKLGVLTTEEKDKLIDFVHGIDAYDDNMNGSTTDKRDWFLGSFLHSRPHMIHYADRSVIYAGANDGMLHAFDDATGEELWGFIPPIFLGRLKDLHTNDPGIFVDGSPKSYVAYDSSGNVTKAILIFGLRRGGDYYYALDVTNPTAPKYLYRLYKGKNGYFNQIGQTWSTPVIGKIAYGTGEKWVAIFGAGYDEDQDLDNPPADDVGRGIYLADVQTGTYVWGRSGVGVQDPAEVTMTYCIPSDVAAIDLNGDDLIDRLYVGDTNSRIWRFDISDLNNNGSSDTSEWTMKKIFEPDMAEKRKVFYPPDVTFEKDGLGNYEMLFFGTGDREKPTAYKQVKNRLYGLKDRNYSGTLIKTDLVDVSDFYNKTPAEQKAMLASIQSKYGWYLGLDNAKKEDLYGEKCLASPVVYNRVAYFTTFSPNIGEITDPCFIGEGTGSLYALNYGTGEAAMNLDLTNDSGGDVVISTSDRRMKIGTAIPSGLVVTVIGGKVTSYIGVGGGVHRPTLSSTRSMFPVHWKLVF